MGADDRRGAAKVALASKAEVAAAVANAKAASPPGAPPTQAPRADTDEVLELAQRDYDKLADCLAREHARPSPMQGDISALEVVEFPAACRIS